MADEKSGLVAKAKDVAITIGAIVALKKFAPGLAYSIGLSDVKPPAAPTTSGATGAPTSGT